MNPWYVRPGSGSQRRIFSASLAACWKRSFSPVQPDQAQNRATVTNMRAVHLLPLRALTCRNVLVVKSSLTACSKDS